MSRPTDDRGIRNKVNDGREEAHGPHTTTIILVCTPGVIACYLIIMIMITIVVVVVVVILLHLLFPSPQSHQSLHSHSTFP